MSASVWPPTAGRSRCCGATQRWNPLPLDRLDASAISGSTTSCERNPIDSSGRAKTRRNVGAIGRSGCPLDHQTEQHVADVAVAAAFAGSEVGRLAHELRKVVNCLDD